MIPHHSTAIMTSDNANLTDSRVQQLSEEIIQAQEEEIAEMEQLIEELHLFKKDLTRMVYNSKLISNIYVYSCRQ